jgi:uncharacterized protein YkwD
MTKFIYFILLLTILPFGNLTAEAKDNSFISDRCNFANQKEMLHLINNYRNENGAKNLKLSRQLNEIICSHTDWMLSYNKFSHTGKDLTNPFERCKKADTFCNAENIAYATNPSTKLFFDLYSKSPSHKKNMLNPNYTEIGIADSEIYNGQIFR